MAILGGISVEAFFLFIALIIASFIVGSFANLLITRLLRNRVESHKFKPIARLVQYGIFLGGVFYGLDKIIQFNVSASLAALGLLGFAIILPMVPILQGYMAGIIIGFERTFREDDYILYADEICKVKDIGLRTTKLRSINGKLYSVPNISFVTNTAVINYTQGEFVRIRRSVYIKKAADVEKARNVIIDICTQDQNILPHIPQRKINQLKKWLRFDDTVQTQRRIKNLNAKVFITSISEDKIELEAVFWIWTISKRDIIVSSFYERVLERFSKEKIELARQTVYKE